MYDMQTLHAGGIPMFRGTYLVHIAPTPPPRKGAASFALKPVTAKEVTYCWLATNGSHDQGVPLLD